MTWTTALGESKPIETIGQQHLSNILWFCEVFNNWTPENSESMKMINDELIKRYMGVRLPWKPLPIPNEISFIRSYCNVDEAGNIFHKGKMIGGIDHIENWKTL